MNRISFFLMVTTLLMCSCSNVKDDMLYTMSETQEDVTINSLFVSVDSLNRNYVHPETRINWEDWTVKTFSAVVDYSIGTVASAATTPVGGAVIGTLASWAYDEHWKNCNTRNAANNISTHRIANQEKIFTPTVIFSNKSKESSFIDSVGYYHNMLLADISASQKKYTTENGDVNYDELFTDISNLMTKYGIKQEKISSNKQIALTSFTDTFIKNTNPNGDNNLDESFSGLDISTSAALGLSNKDTRDIIKMCGKIAEVVPFIEKSELVTYGKEIYNIIDSSTLSVEKKQDFKVLDNIAINSKLYWNSISEK